MPASLSYYRRSSSGGGYGMWCDVMMYTYVCLFNTTLLISKWWLCWWLVLMIFLPAFLHPTHPSWPHQMSHPSPARPGHRQLPFRLLLYSCCWQQRQRLNSSIQQWNIIILCADTPWTEILIDPIDSNADAAHAHTHQRVFYSIHPPSISAEGWVPYGWPERHNEWQNIVQESERA